jgi:uncharacterized protein
MNNPKVYFLPISNNTPADLSTMAKNALDKLVIDNQIQLSQNIPLKAHTGEPGNNMFIRPVNYQGIIEYLKEKNVKPFYIETNTESGVRGKEESHKKVAFDHGFTQIPFIVADGDGFNHVEVEITGGKHFQKCLIAEKLAYEKQMIVISHFKGHCMSGFGGAIKMLGVGFASGRGKTVLHSKNELSESELINWDKVKKSNLINKYGVMDWDGQHVWYGKDFNERVSEYALAAVKNKQIIYITYATSIAPNCDCDGNVMSPVYPDLGIFASLDPVAIDKAVFDELKKREGKKPFAGEEIFEYADMIGLGSSNYNLVILN